MANLTRLSGLVSGMDTDTLVQKMLKVEYDRVDKIKQKQIYQGWKQDAYRDVSTLMIGFKVKYMDMLNPDTNMKLSKNFDVNKSKVQLAGKASNIVDVKVLNSYNLNDFKIDGIGQLATKDTWRSIEKANNKYGFSPENLANQNKYNNGLKGLVYNSKSLTFNIDGVEKKITLDDSKLKDLETYVNDYKSDKGINGDTTLTEEQQKEISSIMLGDFAKNLSEAIEVATGFTNVKDGIKVNENHLEFDLKGHSISYVYQGNGNPENDLAKAIGLVKENLQEFKTKKVVSNDYLVGFNAINYDENTSISDLKNKYLNFKIENKSFSISFDQLEDKRYSNKKELADAIANVMSDQIGYRVDAKPDEKVVKADASGNLYFSLKGKKFSYVEGLSSESDEFARSLGLLKEEITTKSNAVVFNNQFDAKRKLEELGITGDNDSNLNIEINGYKFNNVNKNDTIESLINKINSSSAGVNISYDELKGEFLLQSKKEGVINNIDDNFNEDTKKFLQSLSLLGSDGKTNNRTSAQNAIFKMNGEEIEKPTNKPVINGIEITLNSTFNVIGKNTDQSSSEVFKYDETKPKLDISYEQDTKPVMNLIKNFAEQYNEMIDKLKVMTNERRSLKYQPLTDEMKKDMKEEDIKRWEDKAKQGILRNDTILESTLSKMRAAFLDPMEGSSNTLYDLGIEFSKNYEDGGKIFINEAKLSKAFKDNPDDIKRWFSNISDEKYGKLDSEGNVDVNAANKRYKENGIIQRLQDIIDDATRISSVAGKKGSLVEKAGLKGSFTNTNNDISKLIKSYDEKIDKIMERIFRKEDQYYKKFAQLEVLLAKAQQQQGALGGGSN